MSKFIDLHSIAMEINTPLWQVKEIEGETVLQVIDNVEEDHFGGKVALLGQAKRNYSMQAEFRFIGHHLAQEKAGWFGFILRAQNCLNYEIIWFMPSAEKGKTVAYVPVAHGIVPWWTEAYAGQEKGKAIIPVDSWFQARVDVIGDEFTLFIEDRIVFKKKLTYYIFEGRPGFFVGTATDAMFRRVVIEDIA